MTKSNKSQKRRRPVKASTQITKAVRELTLATQQVLPAQRPDVQKMRVNHRQLYTFERTFTANFNAAGFQFVQPSLNSLPNSSEFTSLFSKYRFLQVVAEIPPWNVIFGGVSESAIFYFDNTPPTTSALLQNLDTYVNHGADPNTTTRTTRVYTPHVIQTGTVSQTLPARQWFGTGDALVEQNGLILNCGAGSGGTNINIILHCIIQFMNPY